MPLFAATDLTCLRGERLVFQGLSFAVEAGGALVLLGPNGSGKSSLLRMMAGLLRPFSGGMSWEMRRFQPIPTCTAAGSTMSAISTP